MVTRIYFNRQSKAIGEKTPLTILPSRAFVMNSGIVLTILTQARVEHRQFYDKPQALTAKRCPVQVSCHCYRGLPK